MTGPKLCTRVSFEPVRGSSRVGVLLGIIWTCTCGETGTVTRPTKTMTVTQRANAAATRHLKKARS